MDNREFKVILEKRTLDFAIEIVKFCMRLRKMDIPGALITQLLKAGTSIGGNYREAKELLAIFNSISRNSKKKR